MTYFEKRMKVVKSHQNVLGGLRFGDYIYVNADAWAHESAPLGIGYTLISGSYACPDDMIARECLEEVTGAAKLLDHVHHVHIGPSATVPPDQWLPTPPAFSFTVPVVLARDVYNHKAGLLMWADKAQWEDSRAEQTVALSPEYMGQHVYQFMFGDLKGAPPCAAPTIAEVAPHPFLVAPAPMAPPANWAPAPTPNDPAPFGFKPAPVAPVSGLQGPVGAAGPDVETPDYKGHENLAEMISGHMGNWAKALETISMLQTSVGNHDDAEWWKHELTALHAIQDATRAELEGVNPLWRNFNMKQVEASNRALSLTVQELIREGHKKDQIIKNLTEQNNELTKQNVDAIDAIEYRDAIRRYIDSSKVQLDAALCLLKPAE
jgi:hypothetical protein